MDQETVNTAITEAVGMVDGIKEHGLRQTAFGVVLSKLLDETGPSLKTPRREKRKPDRGRSAGGGETAPDRILGLREEGFFKQQRSLSEVRGELGTRGWHYELTALSGVMQGLVQSRDLRRVRAKAGNREVWKYSNY